MAKSGFTRTVAVVATVCLGLAAPAAAQPGPAVEAQALESLDLWSAAGRDAGLPRELWAGAHAGLVASALAEITRRPPEGPAAALARRLLAAGARAPEDAAPDLAARRLEALMAQGDLEAVQAILSRTPRIEASEPLSRLQAEAALWRGQDARACDTAQALQAGRDGDWWLRLRALCALVGGRAPTAQLTLDLWRQQGGEDDAFERLFARALAGETGGGAAETGDALAWALSRRLGLAPAADLSGAPAVLVQALARDSRAPRAVRLAAVARGLRLGLVSAEEARAVYAPPEALGAPAATEAAAPPPPPADVAALAALPGAEGEAGLYLLARATADPDLRQAAVLALLGRARDPADRRALARLAAPEIGRLRAELATGDDPAALAVAAALAGDPPLARALLADVPRTAGSADAHAFAALEAIVAAADPARAGPTLDRLVELAGRGGREARAEAAGAALLLAALGAEMDPQTRAVFAGLELPAPRTGPARLAMLEAAAGAGRTGEAALHALAVLAPGSPAPTVADRAAAVRALRTAGLVDEARDLALDGLLAARRP